MKDDLVKIRTYIEENLRKTSVSGIPYIDLHDNKKSITSKQNNVVFGRRGSGKSTLLSEVEKDNRDTIEINLEDYKNITFPNIIIKIVEIIYESINHKINKKIDFNFIKKIKVKKEIKKIMQELVKLFDEDDTFESDIRSSFQDQASLKGTLKASKGDSFSEIQAAVKETTESTVQRKKQFEKLEKIKKNLINYKKILKISTEYLFEKNPLYILIDDFYFIDINFQPYLADVLHVLTKSTNVFIKLASIKHRSKLYIKDNITYQGIEIGHDAVEIDLDYSLEDMDELNQFFTQLLTEIFKTTNVTIGIDDIFGGQGFKQLCIASGGVTRDFLMLLSKCINEIIVSPTIKIGKEIVTAQSASYMVHKLQSLSDDVKKDSEKLEVYINYIKEEVLNKKRINCFLVSKDDLEQFIEERNSIRDLFDMRFIHLIDKNTSCAPSDGKYYEAYILDVGLYDFTRLRNFSQIEPGNKDDRSRKDKMRASPKISLAKLKELRERPSDLSST